MRKVPIALVIGSIFALSACDGHDKVRGPSADQPSAKQIFKQNCASCHGENLQGKSGPALDTIGRKLSKEDILKQMKEGGGGMPGGIIKGTDAENVADWLADMK